MRASKAAQQALSLLDGGKQWIQGQFARNAEGRIAAATDADACSFCAMGAIRRVLNMDGAYSKAEPAVRDMYYTLHNTLNECAWELSSGVSKTIVNLNDHASSFEEVQKAFTCAITKLTAQEAAQAQ